MARWICVAASAVFVFVLFVLVTGCDSSSSSAQPMTLEAATAAAQEKYDRGSAGDFAGEWLLFSKQVRDRLSQADYIKFADACYAKNSPKVKLTGVRMEGTDKAIVRLELGPAMDTRTMVYEDGTWVQEPADDWYNKPVDQIIAESKSQGACEGTAETETETTDAAASTTPATSAAPQPVQSTNEFKGYVDKARSELKTGSGGSGCFDLYQASDVSDLDPNWWTQCMLNAGTAANTLRALAPRLGDEYPETRAVVQKTIDELDHWWQDCASTDPNTQERRECMVYLPREAQLLSIEAAWYEERDRLGLGG